VSEELYSVHMVATRYPVDPILQAPLTVEKYHRMIDAGILGEDDHIELLEGVLVEMSPQGYRHAKFISRFNAATRIIDDTYRVRIQMPLTLPPYGEPGPDIAIVTLEEDEAPERHPYTALLIVEVSSESLRKDRLVKSRVYARAGVPEYWIADVDAQRIEVYREPDPAAERYRHQEVIGRGQTLSPQAFPDLRLALDELFA
jgi:Uma2 family endonuclease